MSDLTRLRDHARTMAGNPDVPADDAALWQQIATEIDEYLDGPPVVEDLFGEYAEEPESCAGGLVQEPEGRIMGVEHGPWPTLGGQP